MKKNTFNNILMNELLDAFESSYFSEETRLSCVYGALIKSGVPYYTTASKLMAKLSGHWMTVCHYENAQYGHKFVSRMGKGF